jgi:hypothetical protein
MSMMILKYTHNWSSSVCIRNHWWFRNQQFFMSGLHPLYLDECTKSDSIWLWSVAFFLLSVTSQIGFEESLD